MATQVEIRHQVAVAGAVTNAFTSAPVVAAAVQISSAPPEFTSWLALRGLQYGADWDIMTSRPDRTMSGADGWFHFVDLPVGAYTLSVSLPRAGSRCGTAQASFAVAIDAQGNIKLTTISVAIPPTVLSGMVTGAGVPVPMAAITVQGSGETALSDEQGKYSFAGLETGNRSVQVLAQGFAPLFQTVNLASAGAAQTLDFALAATAGGNPRASVMNQRKE